MSDGFWALLTTVGIAVGMALVSVLAFFLFEVGKRITGSISKIGSPSSLFWVTQLLIGGLAFVPWLIVNDWLIRACLSCLIIAVLSPPLVGGYLVARRSDRQRLDRERWDRTDEWLKDWENAHRK